MAYMAVKGTRVARKMASWIFPPIGENTGEVTARMGSLSRRFNACSPDISDSATAEVIKVTARIFLVVFVSWLIRFFALGNLWVIKV